MHARTQRQVHPLLLQTETPICITSNKTSQWTTENKRERKERRRENELSLSPTTPCPPAHSASSSDSDQSCTLFSTDDAWYDDEDEVEMSGNEEESIGCQRHAKYGNEDLSVHVEDPPPLQQSLMMMDSEMEEWKEVCGDEPMKLPNQMLSPRWRDRRERYILLRFAMTIFGQRKIFNYY